MTTWGKGAENNSIGWQQGDNNGIGWGLVHTDSWSGDTSLIGVYTDPDAQAFITAASITDPTQQSAVNQLVVDLKAASLWTKMKAVYPFVGGSASSHKWNLKDPRDLDAAFRITFSGGITHNSNGVNYGGVNGVATTNCYGVTGSGYGFGFYSRTNSSAMSTDVYVDAGVHIFPKFSGSAYHRGIGASPDNYAVTDSLGLYQQYGKASSSTAFKNGTKKLTGGAGSSSSAVITFGNTSCDRCHAFAFIANTSFSDTEASNLYTAVQAFQVALSRSV